MREKFKKYELVVILSVLALLMASARLFYKEPGKSSITKVKEIMSLSPTPISSPIKTENEIGVETGSTEPEIALPTNFYDKDYPLWQLLPYVGRGFIIDRYTKPMTLLIKVKGIDKKIVEKDVKEWLEANDEASDSHKLT